MKQYLAILLAIVCLVVSGCESEENLPDDVLVVNDSIEVVPKFELYAEASLVDSTTYILYDDNGEAIEVDFFQGEWIEGYHAEKSAILDSNLMEEIELFEKGNLACEHDNFLGKQRGKVKTSVPTSNTEVFDYLPHMLNTLPTANYMRNQSEIAGNVWAAFRAKEEKRIVRINTCYIHFIKREPDNDFHIILGSHKKLSESVLFNIELSGLPKSTSLHYALLKKARVDFESKFGELCKSGYIQFRNPVKMSVEGALYYDICHRDGAVGPGQYKPKDSWEIHPVTKVQF
ncbi:MAG: hypothetical protein ACI9J3_003249 [Parvicellaceae bacterium]|jgi:hypothetical protein